MNVYTYEYQDTSETWQKGLNPVLATNPCRAIRKAATELDSNGITAFQIEVVQQRENYL